MHAVSREGPRAEQESASVCPAAELRLYAWAPSVHGALSSRAICGAPGLEDPAEEAHAEDLFFSAL